MVARRVGGGFGGCDKTDACSTPCQQLTTTTTTVMTTTTTHHHLCLKVTMRARVTCTLWSTVVLDSLAPATG